MTDMWSKMWGFLLRLVKKPLFWFSLVCIGMNLFFTKETMQMNGLSGFKYVAIVEVVVETVMCFAVDKMLKKKAPIERIFLFAAIVLGSLFIIFLPPGESPDDRAHFRRAYGISDGFVISGYKVNENGDTGSNLPVEIKNMKTDPEKGAYARTIKGLFSEDSGEKSEQVYTTTSLYNFVCYIPQTLAAIVGKVLGMSVIGIAYLMRIFNLICWIVLIYFSIKIIPKYKTAILLISLFPITIQEAASISLDSLTIGLSIFFVAYVLYLMYTKETRLSKKELCLLYALAIIISYCKIVYVPLVLLFLAIPEKRFGSIKKKRIHLLFVYLLVFIASFSWLKFSSGLIVEFNPGVNPGEQTAGMIAAPIKYLVTIARTIGAHGEMWLPNVVGTSLGAFTFGLSGIVTLTSFAMMVLVFSQRNESLKMRPFDKLVFIGVPSSILLLILTSVYVQWTAVGATVIEGVQGRYFLPLLLFIPVIVNSKKRNSANEALLSTRAILFYSIFVNTIALVTIFAKNF